MSAYPIRVCVHAGVTDKDREIVAWLRKLDRSRSSANQAEKRDMFGTLVEIAKPHSKPLLERTVLVVNKVDNEKRAEHVAEFRRLGFPTQVPISAAHNDGTATLRHCRSGSLLTQCSAAHRLLPYAGNGDTTVWPIQRWSGSSQ